ncbi:laminin subunit beta 1, partial [Elysia marginata]
CYCNNHASQCNYTDTDVLCNCQHFTTGKDCERCLPLYNERPWQRGSFLPFDKGQAHVCQKCECNEHADSCTYNATYGRGQCNACKHNTEGYHCEKCTSMFYPNTSVPLSDANRCIACDCEDLGVSDSNFECTQAETPNTIVGQCSCKNLVTGRRCNSCVAGYWGLITGPSPGTCSACNCNLDGTTRQSNTCDQDTGQCPCKTSITGTLCDACADGFFSFPTGNPEKECTPCNCDRGGAISPVCNKDTGVCSCRTGITGDKCDRTVDGRYVPALDELSLEPTSGPCPLKSALYTSEAPFDGRQFAECDLGTGALTVSLSPIPGGMVQMAIEWPYFLAVRYTTNSSDVTGVVTVTPTGNTVADLTALSARLGQDVSPACPLTSDAVQLSVTFPPSKSSAVTTVPNNVTLDARCQYSLDLQLTSTPPGSNKRRRRAAGDGPFISIDSVIPLPALSNDDGSLSFNALSAADDASEVIPQYTDCVERISSLTRRQTALVSPPCKGILFSVGAELYNGALGCPTLPCPSEEHDDDDHLAAGYIVLIFFACLLFLLIVIVLAICLKRWYSQKKEAKRAKQQRLNEYRVSDFGNIYRNGNSNNRSAEQDRRGFHFLADDNVPKFTDGSDVGSDDVFEHASAKQGPDNAARRRQHEKGMFYITSDDSGDNSERKRAAAELKTFSSPANSVHSETSTRRPGHPSLLTLAQLATSKSALANLEKETWDVSSTHSNDNSWSYHASPNKRPIQSSHQFPNSRPLRAQSLDDTFIISDDFVDRMYLDSPAPRGLHHWRGVADLSRPLSSSEPSLSHRSSFSGASPVISRYQPSLHRDPYPPKPSRSNASKQVPPKPKRQKKRPEREPSFMTRIIPPPLLYTNTNNGILYLPEPDYDMSDGSALIPLADRNSIALSGVDNPIFIPDPDYPICFPQGSTSGACDFNSGQCQCHENIVLAADGQAGTVTAGIPSSTGQPIEIDGTCSFCKPNFYGINSGQGCRECACDPQGSTSLQCDESGQCPCKDSVQGFKCDVCKDGFYGFGANGCAACNCSTAGSVSLNCDQTAGTCDCKTNAEGDKCADCKAGFFNLADYNPDGCQPCFCYGHGTTCDSTPGFEVDIIQVISPQLPEHFTALLGDRHTSYSQPITLWLTASFTLDISGSVMLSLTGNGKTIQHRAYNSTVLSQRHTTMYETRLLWREWETVAADQTVAPSTPQDLLSVLAGLEDVRPISRSSGQEITVSRLTLTTATPVDDTEAANELATFVEQCVCNPVANVAGLSCESCSTGHRRPAPVNVTSYDTCVACDCSNRGATVPPECDEVR